MSIEQLKAIVKRNNDEFWNQADMSVADEVFSLDYVRHMPNGRDIRGREAIKQEVAVLRRGFPDLQFTVEDLVAEGDRVAARCTGQGTHRGEYLGIAPTGKRVPFNCIVVFRIAEGRIVEDWVEADVGTMMQELVGGPAAEA
jgi:predicted ester cyclase